MEQVKLPSAAPTICFSVRLPLSAQGAAGGTQQLRLPGDPNLELPARGSTLVEGTINAIPFRAALDSDGRGAYSLKVSEVMQTAAKAGAGEEVVLEIVRVGNEEESRLPADLRDALEATPAALATWADTTAAARRDWVLWLITTRNAQTRARRVEKACDMLAAGKKRVCCFGGMNWLLKTHGTACDS